MLKPTPKEFALLFKPLENVPEEELQYLIDSSEHLLIKEDNYLFQPDQPSDYMVFILSGEFRIFAIQQGQKREITIIKNGDITGILPYSRLETSKASALAKEDSYILRFHRKDMPGLIRDHYKLTEALVHHMSSRIRSFTKYQQQNEKMMALGKLSAGLAHELNNPASAIVRSSKELQSHLKSLPNNFKKVISIKMTLEEVDIVNELLFSKMETKEPRKLSLLQRQEEEEDLADCLEERGYEDGYDAAENLIDFGFSCSDVEMIYEKTGAGHFAPVIKWINDNLTTEKMVQEIEDASSRIADLVSSVKNFTHMDQTPDKIKADIHTGIDNTLVMLNHKLKKKNIKIVKQYSQDLPQPKILVSALNQVWTNLIDNAIDAMDSNSDPELQIETIQDREFVRILVRDNGSGIPEDVASKIFDPFFTTKAIGQGTGLGLDVVKTIVDNHNGSIKVKSKTGETEFEVCIPIE